MNEPDSLALTISKHFDEANTAQETASLAASLVKDRLAAREFARIARLEVLLATERDSATLKRFPWRRWLAAAALAVAGAFVSWHLLTAKTDQSHILQISEPTKRVIRPNFGAQPAAKEKLADLLKRYHVTMLTDGRLAQEIIAELPSDIQAANFVGNRHVESLKITFVPRDPQSPLVGLNSQELSLHQLLSLCSLRGTASVSHDQEVALYNLEQHTDTDGGKQGPYTRTFPIPERFSSALHWTEDPWPKGVPYRLSASKLLEAIGGVTLSEETELAEHEKTTARYVQSHLVLRHRSREHEQVQQGLDVLNEATRVAHLLQTKVKVVFGPTDQVAGWIRGGGQALSPDDFLTFINGLPASVEIIDALSIVTVSYKKALLEPAPAPQPNSRDLETLAVAKSVGEIIAVTGFIRFGRDHRTEFECYLHDSQTACFTLDVPTSPGISAVACVTVDMIDPSGMSKKPHPTVLPPLKPLTK
jgi:hypothetical protein